MRLFFAFLTLTVSLLLSAEARAESVSDGGDFSIDLEGIRLCRVRPVAQEDSPGCAGMTLNEESLATAQDARGTRTVMSGIARIGDGDEEKWAVVLVLAIAQPIAFAPEPSDLPEFSRGVSEGLKGSLPHGAHARQPIPTSLVSAKKGRAIRAEVDVDGIDADAGFEHKTLEHSVSFYLPTESGTTYYVSVSSPREVSADFVRVADRAITTARVAKPAKPRAELVGRVVGFVLGLVSVGGVLLVLVVVLVVRSSRARREAAAYGTYGYGSPPAYPPPHRPSSRAPAAPAWWERA